MNTRRISIKTLRAVNQPGAMELANGLQETLKAQATLEASGVQDAVEMLKPKLDSYREQAQVKGWIDGGPEAPELLLRQVHERSSFARKFDPIRLGLEHQALR